MLEWDASKPDGMPGTNVTLEKLQAMLYGNSTYPSLGNRNLTDVYRDALSATRIRAFVDGRLVPRRELGTFFRRHHRDRGDANVRVGQRRLLRKRGWNVRRPNAARRRARSELDRPGNANPFSRTRKLSLSRSAAL